MHFTLELATSIEELMSSKKPILMSLAEGFKLIHTQCLIANLKKVFIELSKCDDEKKKAAFGKAMIFAPLTMMQLNANVNIQFDDFDEVENHPMAQPLLMTFDQLFEGQMGSPWSELMELKLDAEGVNPESGSDELFGV